MELEKIDATDEIIGNYVNLSIALEKKLEKVTREERIKERFLDDFEKVENFLSKDFILFGNFILFCVLFSF